LESDYKIENSNDLNNIYVGFLEGYLKDYLYSQQNVNMNVSFKEKLAELLGVPSDMRDKFLEPEWNDFLKKYKDYGAVRIILPCHFHRAALLDLVCMNITSATLFPGLDGFSRSVLQHMRNYSKGPPSIAPRD
jgi:hypothetical protein